MSTTDKTTAAQALLKDAVWLEDGEANFYTLSKKGRGWIARIQMNGEFTDQGQKEILAEFIRGSNSAPTPSPDVSVLVEALERCRHQASYSIGGEDALRIQLGKVRDIVNETLSDLAAHRKQEDKA